MLRKLAVILVLFVSSGIVPPVLAQQTSLFTGTFDASVSYDQDIFNGVDLATGSGTVSISNAASQGQLTLQMTWNARTISVPLVISGNTARLAQRPYDLGGGLSAVDLVVVSDGNNMALGYLEKQAAGSPAPIGFVVSHWQRTPSTPGVDPLLGSWQITLSDSNLNLRNGGGLDPESIDPQAPTIINAARTPNGSADAVTLTIPSGNLSLPITVQANRASLSVAPLTTPIGVMHAFDIVFDESGFGALFIVGVELGDATDVSVTVALMSKHPPLVTGQDYYAAPLPTQPNTYCYGSTPDPVAACVVDFYATTPRAQGGCYPASPGQTLNTHFSCADPTTCDYFNTQCCHTTAEEEGVGYFCVRNLSVARYHNFAGPDCPTGFVDQQGVCKQPPVPRQTTDTTAPEISPTITGTVGKGGWYTSNVTISWSVIDNQSAVTATSGCETVTITADTPGETFTCSASSAGDTSSKSVTIKRDATGPTTAGSATPAPNANGWRKQPVTVSFACTDVTSGIATCTGPQTVGEGANQSVNGIATDNAGNTATTSVSGINVDLTPPLVRVTKVTDGATYLLGSVPLAACSTSDALSGVQTNATLTLTGGDGHGLGTFVASCQGASDKAGNSAAASATYKVVAAAPNAAEFSKFDISSLLLSPRLRTLFLQSSVSLGVGNNGIHPAQEPVTLKVGNSVATIPAGAFRQMRPRLYVYAGRIDGVALVVTITSLSESQFRFQVAAYGVNLRGVRNPVPVALSIGDDHGASQATARIR